MSDPLTAFAKLIENHHLYDFKESYSLTPLQKEGLLMMPHGHWAECNEVLCG